MTASTQRPQVWSKPRLFALAAVAAIVAIFVAANWHLVTVSLRSHPDCVTTLPQKGVATYAAAKPSC